MDDVQVGSVIRAVRIRRGLRQSDVAALANVSGSTVSLVERGLLEGLTVRSLRRVAGTLGVWLPFGPRWRGAELAKLLDEKHALMVRDVVARASALGWQVLPEHTFSWRGERGSIDVLAWLPAQRALLVIEVKTRIVDLQDLLSTLDRKRRLAPIVAQELGWQAAVVGAVLALPDETWARNVLARFEPLFSTALPVRNVEIRAWLRRADGPIRGVWFLPSSSPGSTRRSHGGVMRVRKRPNRVGQLAPRSGRRASVGPAIPKAAPEVQPPT
jgi:transcriptional regulator with XRE-family HTH domain